MVYIPILKTLEVLQNNDTVLTEVRITYIPNSIMYNIRDILQISGGHRSTTNALKDYCDGESYATHPLFSIDASSFQILFYYDEVEICNPIGSSRSKHKLGKFRISRLYSA